MNQNRPGLAAALLLLLMGAHAVNAQPLVPSSTYDIELAGQSVAIDGDLAVVGAPYEDNNKGINAGAAYIFERNGNVWTQVKRIAPADAGVGDRFGWSVGISGNWVIVGSPHHNGVGDNSGAAYLFFRRNSSLWSFRRKLVASDAAAYDRFGWSVTIDGSYAAMGALNETNSNGDQAGAAYVFYKGPNGWAQQKKLIAGDGAVNDHFGASIAIDGNNLVVGAPHKDINGSQSGAVYVFTRNGTNWPQFTKKVPDDNADGDSFGNSVSINGNYVAVGAVGDDNANGEFAGALYLFRKTDNSLVQEAKKIPTNGSPSMYFGESVDVSGIYAIAGAPGADNYDGRAIIYKRVVNEQGVAQWQYHRSISTDEEGDDLGHSVSITDTYAVIGAPHAEPEAHGLALAYNYLAAASPQAGGGIDPEVLSGALSVRTELPDRLVLHGNYPNPFNPSTDIRFDLPEQADVRVEVIDLMGRRVLHLDRQALAAGLNQITVDASHLPSGIYLYRLEARTVNRVHVQAGRMTLIK